MKSFYNISKISEIKLIRLFAPLLCAVVLNSIWTTEKLGSSLPGCVWE